jgi:hypothetical protein
MEAVLERIRHASTPDPRRPSPAKAGTSSYASTGRLSRGSTKQRPLEKGLVMACLSGGESRSCLATREFEVVK